MMKIDSSVKSYLRKILREIHKDLNSLLIAVIGFIKPKVKHLLKPSILILPPAAQGSLGDEAMIASLICELKLVDCYQIGILSFRKADSWNQIDGIDEIITIRTLVKKLSETDKTDFIIKSRKYQNFSIIGADVLDGAYSVTGSINRLKLAVLADKLGLTSSIVNFSMNDSVSDNIKKEFQRLPSGIKLISRDPVSKERLERIITHRVELSADVAFLLHPIDSSPVVDNFLNWISTQRKSGKTKFIGININPQILGKDLDQSHIDILVSSYTNAMIHLSDLDNSISYVFLPHSFSNPINDLTLTNLLRGNLPDPIRVISYLPLLPYKAVEVQRICKELDYILTGRMHLAVLGLSQGIPIACIAYQGKFEGLIEHFGVSGITLSKNDSLDSEILSTFVTQTFTDRENKKHAIEQKLQMIKNLAKRNIVTCEN